MSTVKQDSGFKKAIGEELPNSLLGTAIDWIRDNMNPDEVFDQARLNQFVGNTAKPEEVFSKEELEAWATEHRFLKDTSDKILTYG